MVGTTTTTLRGLMMAVFALAVGCNTLLGFDEDFVAEDESVGGAGGTNSGTTTGTSTGTTTGTSTGTATGTAGGTGGGTSTGSGTGSGGCIPGTIYFSEDFSDNAQGWDLETEWAIGSAAASTCQTQGNSDPAADHSSSGDNGVAGVVLGGCYSTGTHAYYHLTSPTIDLSSASGPVYLSFWRWLNTGATVAPRQVVSRLEVWDGAQFVGIWQSSSEVTDAAWLPQEFDVTQYKGPAFSFRVGFAILANGGSTLVMSGWNVDDVTVSSGTCD